MSVIVEAVSVVIKRNSIRTKFPGGWSLFQSILYSRYSMCADSSLASVNFLAAKDAYTYTKFLGEIGFVYLQDFAIADQTQGLKDSCDWCYITNFEIDNNAVTGCKLEGCGETKLPANHFKPFHMLLDWFRVQKYKEIHHQAIMD